MNGSQSSSRILRVLADGRILLYNFLVLLYSPRILFKKIRPYLNNRKHHFDLDRWRCRTYNLREKTDATRVVMAGMGWGEMRVTELLTTQLKEKRPDLEVVWSFCDFSAIDAARKEFPEQAITFMPFDFLLPVLTWLRKLSPDVVVSIEKVLVPNLICASRRWGAETLCIGGRSGRLRGNKFTRGIYRFIYRWMFQNYTMLCLQGKSDFAVLEPVMPRDLDVRVTGAIKLSHSKQEEQPVPPELLEWLDGRGQLPLLIAGSTREGEEGFILEAFGIVQTQFPCALLLAPRRLHRTDEVVSLIEQGGYSYSRRSEFTPQNPRSTSGESPSSEGSPGESTSVQVYLLDTIGELASAYQFSQAAYVGGTLHSRGHNVIEPVEWGVPVLFGPGKKHMIVPPQVLCIEAGVGFRVHTPEELAAQWLKLLKDEGLREAIRVRCREVVEHQQRVLEESVDAIIEAADRVENIKNIV